MLIWRAIKWLFTKAEPCDVCYGKNSLYDDHFVCDACFNSGYIVKGESPTD